MSEPDATPPNAELAAARAWVTRFTRGAKENFSVLSMLVPREHREHFASVYAFCRVADDLADETGSDAAARDRSRALLASFRDGLRSAFDPAPAWPSVDESWRSLFTALAWTIRERRLPAEPFHHLLDAFEADQVTTRYARWEELLAYSERSANPVGRLVLMILGYRPPAEAPEHRAMFAASDDLCTALQLINFWQDVRRDLLERDRIYLPLADCGIDEKTLRSWLAGPPRAEFGRVVLPLVDRTEELFDRGDALMGMLPRSHARVICAFAGGGREVVRKVRAIDGATLWHRPRVGAWNKARIVIRALLA